MRFGGRQVPGFGVGLTIEEATAELEKSDPCAACHHDTYSKLRTFGAVVAGMGIGAGLYGLYRGK
jgi:hypothetical protein